MVECNATTVRIFFLAVAFLFNLIGIGLGAEGVKIVSWPLLYVVSRSYSVCVCALQDSAQYFPFRDSAAKPEFQMLLFPATLIWVFVVIWLYWKNVGALLLVFLFVYFACARFLC